MSKHATHGSTHLSRPKLNREVVDLLNQSLADSLDLAYQTKQAHWNVKGANFYSLHLLFDVLYDQLVVIVDDFAERAVTLGGQAHGTIRAAGMASNLPEYPLELKDGHLHVDALVDRYGHYTERLRKTLHELEHLGDLDTAEIYTSSSRAMEKALWMLSSHQEN
jgi:starvation-inducible DNA-binding protein